MYCYFPELKKLKMPKISGLVCLFLLKIKLDFLLRKTGASLNFKIELLSLNISPGEDELSQCHIFCKQN
jgi:hypothetical protein